MRHTALLMLAMASLSACATVERGTTDYVRVDTVPQGARVTVLSKDIDLVERNLDGRHTAIKTGFCTTPCAVQIPRTAEALVRIDADGYEPFEYVTTPSLMKLGSTVSAAKNATLFTGAGAFVGVYPGLLFTSVLQSFGGPAVSTPSGLVTATTGVGIGVAAMSMTIDSGTGANLNVFPNPVVVGLAPSGSEVEIDPLVAPLRAAMAAIEDHRNACVEDNTVDNPACVAAYERRVAAQDAFAEARQARDDAIRQFAKEARARGAQSRKDTP